MHILFDKLTSNSSKKFSFSCLETTWRPAAPETGFLQLLNLEAYPKNLKTWENLSHKNDFIPYNLSSQSKDKAYTHGLRKCVKTFPPLAIFQRSCINFFAFYLR